jgi:drug/metabolite transporter (DMT)-like permease
MGLALVFLMILGSIWGVSTSTQKLALEAYAPLSVMFWYALIAFVVLAVISAVRGKVPPFDRRHLFYYLASGLFGFAIPGINNLMVLAHVPAGIHSTVIATAPVFTYGIALAARQERFIPMRAAGVGLGLVGVLCIIVPRSGLPDAGMAPWVAMGLLTPFLYGLTAVVISRYMPRETDAPTLATGFVGVATAGFFIALLLLGDLTPPWPPVWPATHMILWLGVTASLAYVLYFQIIRLAGPVYLSQVGYLVVVVGVITGMLVFGERHSLWVWLGIGLMVGGLTLVNVGQRSAVKKP